MNSIKDFTPTGKQRAGVTIIKEVTRENSSKYGNPRWAFLTDGGAVYKTKPDSSIGWSGENIRNMVEKAGEDGLLLWVVIDGRNNIIFVGDPETGKFL